MELVTKLLENAMIITMVGIVFASVFAALLIWKKKTSRITDKYEEVHELVDDAIARADAVIQRTRKNVNR